MSLLSGGLGMRQRAASGQTARRAEKPASASQLRTGLPIPMAVNWSLASQHIPDLPFASPPHALPDLSANCH